MLPDGYARLKLLFVDDALPTRILLREILRGTGLQQVTIADDATMAFESVKADLPDLVFTDWQMPGRSGLDLLRDIRENPESPDPLLPVIMLTAKDSQDDVIRGRDAGATGYLIKPITLGGIVERINDAVHKPRAFLVSPNFVGPDRSRGRLPIAGAGRIMTTPDGMVIPPDYLLAAKVNGDREAVRKALRDRADAIMLVRRIFHPGAGPPTTLVAAVSAG
jgi:CheY-like chemotaxis protein